MVVQVADSLPEAVSDACPGGGGGIRRRRRRNIQFFLGPAYTGAPPHTHGAAWNALAHGLKLWFLFPPSSGYYVSKPIVDWLQDDYARVVGEGRAPLLAVQRAGEVVHVPQGWAHAVLNLKESIGVAEEYACG